MDSRKIIEGLIKGYNEVKPSYIVDKGCNVKVSVVIPTYNRYKLLKKTLDALFVQTFKDFEIIVVDDDSDDKTLEMIKSLEFPVNFTYLFWGRDEKFIPGKPMNRAGPVRNLGVKWAKGDIILFLDTDIVANQKLVEEHYNSHTGRKDIVIGPSIREIEGYDLREGLFYTCEDDPMKLVVPWVVADEGNISFNRKWFEENGSFGSEFIHWAIEGDELAYRLIKNGSTIKWNRKAWGTHLYHSSENITMEEKLTAHNYNANVFYNMYKDQDIKLRFLDRNARKRDSKRIDLFDRCNNNCRICSDRTGYMNLDDIRKKMKAGNSYLISGGEPAIRKDFFNIISIIEKRKIKAELVTNARIFSIDKFAKKVLPIIKNYTVKLYSADRKVHDHITRVKGSYKQTIAGLKNIIRYGGAVAARILITERNQEIRDLLDMMKALGIGTVSLNILRPHSNPKRYLYNILNQLDMYNFNYKVRFDIFPCINFTNYKILLSNKFLDHNFHITKLKHCRFCEYVKKCKGRFEFDD